MRRCNQLVVGAGRVFAQLVDDHVGHHRREQIASAEIQRELVQQRDRVGGELPSLGGGKEPGPAPPHEPLPEQALAKLPHQNHVRLSMRHPEQLGIPPTRPSSGSLADDNSREPVGLGERDATVVRGLEEPASRSRRRGGYVLGCAGALLGNVGGVHRGQSRTTTRAIDSSASVERANCEIAAAVRPPVVVVSLAWFPSGEYEEAISRWRSLAEDWVDVPHRDYSARLDGNIRWMRRKGVPIRAVAPILVEDYVAWCAEHNEDPEAARAA